MAKSKEIAGLDCEASASAGIRLVLRSRLEEMFTFREAALDWSDPEGIHDMRVASRRLRGAIRDFSPYLRKRKLHYPQNGLKSLADALGVVRDHDVAIMALEKLSTEAPPEVSAGVEELTNDLRLERDRARSELEEALAENPNDELQEELNVAFERALKTSRPRKSKRVDQTLAESVSFRQVGCDILAARVEELQAASTSFYRPLKIRPLHQMRLVLKRLRYASELFAPCWTEPLAPFCKEIAKLQTSLGELHDCDVWITKLGSALRDMERESEGAQPQKRSACIWLLDYFLSERAGHFSSSLRRWQEWERTSFLASLTAIVEDKPLAEYAQRPEN